MSVFSLIKQKIINFFKDEPPAYKWNIYSKDVNAKEIYCSQNVCQKRGGYFITMETHSSQLERTYMWTEYFYSNIRNANGDIMLISKNTNIPEDTLEIIKQHIFLEEHVFSYEIQRFTIDEDIAAAWHRLYQNAFTKSDLVLLQQAYAEALVMEGKKIEYKAIHNAAKTAYNWLNSLES